MGWWLSRLLGYLLSFLFPMYKSLKAIQSESKEDDTQWLIYWVIIGLVNTAEAIFFIVLDFLPFYYEIKLAFVIWLQYPSAHGCGAAYLYETFFKPFLAKYDNNIDSLLNDVFKSVKSLTSSEGVQNVIKTVQNFVATKLPAVSSAVSGRKSK